MKKLLALLALLGAVTLAVPSWADDKAATAPVATVSAPAAASAAAAPITGTTTGSSEGTIISLIADLVSMSTARL